MAPDPTVTVELPAMLAALADGARRVPASGATCAEALGDLCRRHPALRVHLFDEHGRLRQHVLCFVNDVNTRWVDTLDIPVRDGDRLTILQAVSGG